MWARWLNPGPLATLFAQASAVTGVGVGLALMGRRARVAEPNYLEGAYFFVLVPLISPQGWDYLLLLALPGYMCLVDRWRDTTSAWRAVAMMGFLLTSFGTYELLRRTLYFFLMGWGAGTIGAILVAASLFGLRWRRLA
jgi:hypothetical protein